MARAARGSSGHRGGESAETPMLPSCATAAVAASHETIPAATEAARILGCFTPALRAARADPSATRATTPAVVPVSNAAVEIDPVMMHLAVPGRRKRPTVGRSFEGPAMLLDERFERHRGPSAELLDEVVGAFEDAVLVVDHGYIAGAVIGRGGMGVVYKARHLRLNRDVAVKMMLNGGYAGVPELARFQHEAEALAALQHPNVVQIHDVGESGGLPYFTMELVDGGNLAQKLGGVPQSARDAAALMIPLADAVEAAHRRKIVHRDLKPSNILLTAGGTPKITDFGLARRLELGVGLSMTATRIGTPGYMAPEQVAGTARVSGPATDIYSLGAVFYELLTGRPPFRAETERQVLAEDPAPPSRLNAQVPRDLETICLKCLRKDPQRRYARRRSSGRMSGDSCGTSRSRPARCARPSAPGNGCDGTPRRTVTLSGALLIASAILAGGWWTLSARSLVAHAIEEDLRVATHALRNSRWGEAHSALERARGRLGPGEYGESRRRLDRATLDQDLVGQLSAIRLERRPWNKDEAARREVAYEEAFRDAGLLRVGESPGVAGDRLGRSDVKDALIVALDEWALCAVYSTEYWPKGSSPEENGPMMLRLEREAWLLDVVKRADPDARGWRDRFRDPSVRRDRGELTRLAESARIAETPIHLLVSLGELLKRSGGDPTPFLLTVQRQHPDDLYVNYFLGYHALVRGDGPEALRDFQAALATRPDSAFLHDSIGHAFYQTGRVSESIAYYERGVKLDPNDVLSRARCGNREKRGLARRPSAERCGIG